MQACCLFSNDICANVGLYFIGPLGTYFSKYLNAKQFREENGIEGVVCIMAAILSLLQCSCMNHFGDKQNVIHRQRLNAFIWSWVLSYLNSFPFYHYFSLTFCFVFLQFYHLHITLHFAQCCRPPHIMYELVVYMNFRPHLPKFYLSSCSCFIIAIQNMSYTCMIDLFALYNSGDNYPN